MTKEELEQKRNEMLGSDVTFTRGRRNDDMVDYLIASWCLGIDPDLAWVDLLVERKIDPKEVVEIKKHFDRVVPYLSGWGEYGTMEALTYAIDLK